MTAHVLTWYRSVYAGLCDRCGNVFAAGAEIARDAGGNVVCRCADPERAKKRTR